MSEVYNENNGIIKLIRCFLMILCGFTFNSVGAENIQMAVIYPESKGSYSKVYKNIISGVGEQQNIDLISKAISKTTSAEEVDQWLLNNNVQTVIALGHRSYKLSESLKSNLPVTVGALVVSSNTHSGISLAADPRIFFQKLELLAPDIRRVFVVYSEKNTGWLINFAEKAALERDIELVLYKAESIAQGIRHYDTILSQTHKDKDAIWIPLDRVVPIKTILPKILEAAWKNNIVTFSNNPLHAKRGTLFALFPDNKLMGQNLAKLAAEQVAGNADPHLIPTTSLKLAVNKRTALHLGLHYSKTVEEQFDIVFPSE